MLYNKSRPQSYVYRDIWEKHNGKIPHGYHIHHIDGNPNNNHISNLSCVSPIEHYEIHKSQGDTRAAGLLYRSIFGVDPENRYYYGSIPHKDAHALQRMNHGLIRVSDYAKDRGVEEPEVELKEDMTEYDTMDAPYEEEDFSRLYHAIQDISDRSGLVINEILSGKSEKQIAKAINRDVRTVRRIKQKAIEELKLIL